MICRRIEKEDTVIKGKKVIMNDKKSRSDNSALGSYTGKL